MKAPPLLTDPAETLQAWQARADALRERLSPVGLADPAALAGRPGIEIFEAMLDGRLPPPPITRTLDFQLVEAAPGRVAFQGRPRFDHYNPLGTVHGGWIATLLDSALACAVHTLLPAGKAYTTLELKVNFVKGLTERVPLVRALGEIVHLGRQVGTAEGRLVGPDGTLFAHASTTCLLLDARS